MGTRSAVCEPHGDSYRGRYAHWDGYPTAMARSLWALVERDGLDVVRQTIIHDHYGWSTINTDQTVSTPRQLRQAERKRDAWRKGGGFWSPLNDDPLYDAYSFSIGKNDGRFAQVAGYGIAYTTEQGQSSPDEWIGPSDDYGTEWRYVLGDDGLWIYVGYGENPRLLSTHRWDEPEPDWETVEKAAYPDEED